MLNAGAARATLVGGRGGGQLSWAGALEGAWPLGGVKAQGAGRDQGRLAYLTLRVGLWINISSSSRTTDSGFPENFQQTVCWKQWRSQPGCQLLRRSTG